MITHSEKIPFVTLYWDFYILSRLHHDVSMVLQRCDMWNSTKEGGNVHGEVRNEQMQKAGKRPTQDTSRWFYKTQEELAWELMGVTCEKKLSTRKKKEEKDAFRIIDFLIDDLKYLESRSNPDLPFDRKKQYLVNTTLLQQHTSYLSAIIELFQLPIHHLTSIFHVVETLTQEKIYIDEIGLPQIIERLLEIQKSVQEVDMLREIQAEHNKGLKRADRDVTKYPYAYPLFVVNGLNKIDWDMIEQIQHNIPYRNFAEWKAKNCVMQNANMRNANGNVSASIPQNFGSNSRLLTDDTTKDTNKEQERTAHADTQSSKDVDGAIAHINVPLIFLSNFLATDSREKPTKLVVFMTSEKYNAEVEDDRRGWVATELKWKLEQQGHVVTLEFQQEQDEDTTQIVDAFAAIDVEEMTHARKPLVNNNTVHPIATSDETIGTTNINIPEAPVDASLPTQATLPDAAGATQENGENADEGNKGTEKGNKGRKKKTTTKDISKVTPLPKPQRPDKELPWNVEKVLLWGDYFRGHKLKESTRTNSLYVLAQEGAISIIERGISEANYVAVHRFMLGVTVDLEKDEEFRDDWWPENESADVWNVEKHYKTMAAKLLKRKQEKLGIKAVENTRQQKEPITPSKFDYAALQANRNYN